MLAGCESVSIKGGHAVRIACIILFSKANHPAAPPPSPLPFRRWPPLDVIFGQLELKAEPRASPKRVMFYDVLFREETSLARYF